MKTLSKTCGELSRTIKNWFLPTKENNFNPSFLSDRAISIFILLFLLIKVIFSFNLILVKQSSLFADVSSQEIFHLTNETRQQFGLSPLKENPLLNQAAQYKAADMLKNSYFSHYSPTGISPWYWIEQAGYDYYYAGENLAMNFLDSKEVIQGWFNSPTHRDNLLNANYQEMGIAVISGDFNNEGINRILVVQLFGSPRLRTSTPIAQAQETTPEDTPELTPEITEKITQKATQEDSEEQPQATIEKPLVLEATSSLETIEETIPETIVGKEQEEKPKSELIIEPSLVEQQNVLQQIGKNTRNQINLIDKIIAGLMMSFGLVILAAVILQRQSVNANFSELVLRSFIVIILGASFITFHLEEFIGRLMI